MNIRVGCCGFPRGMEAYFREFSLVEVQQTFYRLPKRETAEGWRRKAPEGFEFTVKAHQAITHPPSSPTYRRAQLNINADKEDHYGYFRPTAEVREAWGRTREIALALEARVVLFQCPASFTPSPEGQDNFRAFFQGIEREFLFAWEPRGAWPPRVIKGLCRELELIHCVDPLVEEPLWGKVKYFRLHGGRATATSIPMRNSRP